MAVPFSPFAAFLRFIRSSRQKRLDRLVASIEDGTRLMRLRYRTGSLGKAIESAPVGTATRITLRPGNYAEGSRRMFNRPGSYQGENAPTIEVTEPKP